MLAEKVISPEVAARRAKGRANYAKNREALLARHRAWGIKNAEKKKAGRRQWRRANREHANAMAKQWKVDNAERVVEYAKKRREEFGPSLRAAASAWRKNNPDKQRGHTALRRARIAGVAHPEHSRAREQEMRAASAKISSESGKFQHLDHIIPLSAGGWHHHDNMQVLPASVNLSKKDDPFWESSVYRTWRDVPDKLWPEALIPEYLSRARSESAEKESRALAA